MGAIGLPAAVAVFQRAGGVRLLLWLISAALAVAAVLVSRGRLDGVGPRRDTPPAAGHTERGGVSRRHAVLFGAILFVYVGTETAVSGWIALYVRRLAVAPSAAALAAPSVFWAALLIGRAAAPLVLRRVAEIRLVAGGVVLAGAGIAAILAAGSAAMLALGIAAAGLGCATVFPITVALFTRDFGRDAARYAGVVFALAALGGATLPWLVGVVSSQTGALKSGLFVPLGGCAAVLALHEWRRRRSVPAIVER